MGRKLAQEAARLMIEHGIADFGLAKRKAAEKLAMSRRGVLPSNAEIQACLAERQRIFEPETHPDRLHYLRGLAADLMSRFDSFAPRLVGAVLEGTATASSGIELHLFCDTPEEIAAHLDAQGIRFGHCERRYRFAARKSPTTVPGFKFDVDGVRIWSMVFPEKGLREAPRGPVDQRPMARASRARVCDLMAGGV